MKTKTLLTFKSQLGTNQEKSLPEAARLAWLTALVWCSTLSPQLSTLFAQGTAFTYQGRFNTNSAPYTGSVEFQFTLWDAVSGGGAVATNNPVSVISTVTDGLFTTPLEFGSDPLNGQPRFLQIEARTTIGPFFTLTPRQPLMATPYALRALNLTTNGLTAGIYTSAVTFNNAGNNFFGRHSGNGGNLTNVNATTLGGLGSASFWRTTGNAGVNPTNGAFLGTTDNLPVEFKVNGLRALRIEYATNAFGTYSPNLVGGYPGNVVSNGVVGGVIGGGGEPFLPNLVGGHFATVVGGEGNVASGPASTAMGYETKASDFASTAMGESTTASGSHSTAMGRYSTASGFASTAMGHGSTASEFASTAMGYETEAGANYSTAMGHRAEALHEGSFVWADKQTASFSSTAVNQFSLRASGGVRLSDDTALSFGSAARQMIHLFGLGYGIGVQSSTTYFRSNSRFSWFAGGVHSDTQNAPGAGGSVLMTLTSGGLTVNGVVVSSSDRNVKAGFTPVDPKSILEKVTALPIHRWHFRNDVGTPHLGPMAQDFHAAFRVGMDDKHIATVDADGVALAAIQGLNQKLEETRMENADLKRRLEALEKILQEKSR